MPRVAFVTCQQLPEPDPDESLLMGAAASHGIDAELAAWDDESVEWARFDLAVVRSTWNYHLAEQRFRTWIADVATKTRLWNPAGLMLRTIHKSYLVELAAAGVPIVPTRIMKAGSIGAFQTVLGETGWTRFVLKPAVSGGSFMTRSFTDQETTDATKFADEILSLGDLMVQPYLSSVESGGEVALVLIDGEITHAIAKQLRFHDDEESVSAALVPTKAQRTVGNLVMAQIPEQTLYGRIDLMRLNDGEWALSEAEFIEPSLFFLQHPPALELFLQALHRLAGG